LTHFVSKKLVYKDSIYLLNLLLNNLLMLYNYIYFIIYKYRI